MRDFLKALRLLAGGLVVWGGSMVGLNIAFEWLTAPDSLLVAFGGLLLAGIVGVWYALGIAAWRRFAPNFKEDSTT